MREDVAHAAGQTAPFCLQRSTAERAARTKFSAPFRRRHLGHAAQEAARRTSAQQNGAIGAERDERGTTAQRAFCLRYTAWKNLLCAAPLGFAAVVPRAKGTIRLLRRADRGAEIHHRLGKIAGAVIGCLRLREPFHIWAP